MSLFSVIHGPSDLVKCNASNHNLYHTSAFVYNHQVRSALVTAKEKALVIYAKGRLIIFSESQVLKYPTS